VKLQKQSSRKYNEKEYEKWVVVIPTEKIKESGWKAGEELEVDFKGDKLLIKRKSSN